jgi:quercetin 2,3-dioxygenase
MRTLRPADARGHADHGWLRSRFSFSFADYVDPDHMGFCGLRVINDDRIAADTGFGMHGHRDMEIISWLVSGQLAHQDSLGHGAVITPGLVQVMSAGSGIRHSERNPGPGETRLLQVWIEPNRTGGPPSYVDRDCRAAVQAGGLVPIATRDGRGGTPVLRAHADVFASRLAPGATVRHTVQPGRAAWIQMAVGTLSVDGTALSEGDGLAIADAAGDLTLVAGPHGAEVLLFDLNA